MNYGSKYVLKNNKEDLNKDKRLCNTEAYSKTSRKSKMELFTKISNGFKLLTIFAKSSILDVRLGSKYVSVILPKYCAIIGQGKEF